MTHCWKIVRYFELEQQRATYRGGVASRVSRNINEVMFTQRYVALRFRSGKGDIFEQKRSRVG